MPTLTQLKEAVAIAEKIEKLQTELARIIGYAGFPSVTGKVIAASAAKTGKRTMSPATIAKMRASQQARWAKPTGTPTPVAKAAKRTMSSEARERIAAAQRARWAKTKGPSADPAAAIALPSSDPKSTKGKRVLSPEGRARIVAALKARHAAARKAKG